MPRTQQQTLTLTLRRRYRSHRETVFAAWTDPAVMKKWFAPEGATNPAVEVDLRVGGGYRIEMLTPDGRRPVAVGRYREVSRPERLVFTWAWEGDVDDAHAGETLVTVDFLDHGGETEVVVTQEGFETLESRDGHEQGWISCVARLEALLEELSLPRRSPGVLTSGATGH